MTLLPFVQEIAPAPSVANALRTLSHLKDPILFDSSLTRTHLGKYSFFAADPFDVIEVPVAEYGANPFAEIAEKLQHFPAETAEGLPPFQGGAAGLLSYELGHCFERLPVAPRNEFQIPAAVIGLYSWVLAWDHSQQRCWFIGQGYPEQDEKKRRTLALKQFREISQLLSRESSGQTRSPSCEIGSERRGAAEILFPDPEVPIKLGLRSNLNRASYLESVQKVIDYIRAGDIFQANLSQRFLFPAKLSPLEQYLRLRETNPAPFAGYFAHEDWAIMSSSPERFLQLSERTVSTRPIKGTRQRRSVPEADLFTRDELRESEKDRAENVMIVDLLRNDLSRVCKSGSIRVPELCTVEVYETVSHLVSEVSGILQDEATFWDLVQATFPGGSITGAPKIRAMEIITELEQVARGAYCGSLFYFGFDGTADSNILIRTMTHRHGWLTFSAGGGIVSQSEPQLEYEETLHKARGILNALKVEGGR